LQWLEVVFNFLSLLAKEQGLDDMSAALVDVGELPVSLAVIETN
jgi:hypothetical protein